MKHLKTLLILLAFFGLSMSSALAQTYHTGDIAVVNAIIDNNGLAWTKAPTDGSSVPTDWTDVTWTTDATNKRVDGLALYSKYLTGNLNVSGLDSLKYLGCETNNLSTLNLSGLSKLEYLDCSNNNLTTLNLSGLSSLENLGCSYNNLTTLNLNEPSKLKYLGCTFNNLSALDVNGQKDLVTLFCSNNKLTSLVVNGLNELMEFYCNDNNLSTLTVSGLDKLDHLICDHNNLSILDVSELETLRYLRCDNNKIETLILNTNVESIDCSHNNLTALNINSETSYIAIECSYNNLTTLNVTGTAAFQIGCSYNSLTTLDVTGLTLYWLDCRYNLLPNKSAVTGFSTTGWDNISFFFDPQRDAPGTYNPDDIAVINAIIENNGLDWTKVHIIDGSFVPADWTGVTWDGDPGDTNRRIDELNVTGKYLYGDLDVSGLDNLRGLDCSNNNLNTLNASGLKKIEGLSCMNNNLTTLDMSGLNNLRNLACNGNKLSMLNVNDTFLEELYCYDNNLTTLDVTDLPLAWLHCHLNYMPDESAVIGFEDTWNDLNFTFDPQKQYNTDDIAVINNIIDNNGLAWTVAPTDGTTIPADWTGKVTWNGSAGDINRRIVFLGMIFEGLYGNLDVRGLDSLNYLMCNYNNLSSVNLNGLNNLGIIELSDNNLNTLDVSELNNLIVLKCYSNNLNALDVNGLNNLEVLDCRYNNISTLDVSGVKNLRELNCGNSNLNTLIVNGADDLETLYCDGNNLTALDVSKVKKMRTLSCYENNLSKLNVSGIDSLRNLYCYSNNLSTLDLSGLNRLRRIACNNNNLTSLNVTGFPLRSLDCSLNYIPDTLDVIGFENIWDDIDFYFYPQKTISGIVSVTGITDLITHADAGIPVKLVGTIIPDTATFQAIDWSIIDAGSTGAVISGVDSDIFTATSAGTVKMKAFILNGINIGTPYEQEFSITVTGVGIEQLRMTNDELRVYPNPTTGELRVTSNELQVTSIEIFDMMGRRHECTKARMHEGTKGLVMDISAFPAGIYLLRIQTEKGVVMKKVVKQ